MRLDYKKLLEKKDYLPFYVYDYETIKGQILKLKKYLPPNVKVFYSVKANPNIAILRIMKNFGLEAEIVSFGEFLAAKRAGFKSNNIIFAGAKKTDNDFLKAVKNKISLISLESLSEIKRLNRVAKILNKKQPVIIRIQPGQSKEKNNENYPYKRVSHFGLPLIEFEKLLVNFSSKFSNLDLRGIHVYNISRILNPDIFLKEIERIFFVIHYLETKFKLHFEILDIGGGFGSTSNEELPIADITRQLKRLINKNHFNNHLIILELGRYLVNVSGAYVSRIIETEKRDNVNFLYIEGIMNHLVRVLIKTSSDKNQARFSDIPADYKIKILPQRKSRLYPTIICGQLSSFADTFGRHPDCQYLLPRARTDDFLVIEGVGAYGLTQAFVLFGSRPFAAEFLLINGKLELIRDKGKPEDFLLNQKIPPILKNKLKP